MKNHKIQLPAAEEIIEAVLSADNDKELTDRELWILQEFGGGDL